MTISDLSLLVLDFHSLADTVANRKFVLAGINAAWKHAELKHDFSEAWTQGYAMLGAAGVFTVISIYTNEDLTGDPFVMRDYTKFEKLNPDDGLYYEVKANSVRTRDLLDRRSDLLCLPANDEFRILQHGNRLMVSDGSTEAVKYRFSGYRLTDPWTGVDIPPFLYSSGPDMDATFQEGWEYLMWYAVCFVNYKTQVFVNRQEGTLSPPEKKMQECLDALITWDTYRGQTFLEHKIIAP